MKNILEEVEFLREAKDNKAYKNKALDRNLFSLVRIS